MKYMGSKNRYAKELLEIILKDRKEGQWYVEPFVGGFNLIDKVPGNRIASDTHFYLTELFRALQRGWIPPENITEEEYKYIRDNKKFFEPYLVGFVGFGCSYSGKWFGGYARGNDDFGNPRNYCNESRKNVLKQVANLQDVIIFNLSYSELLIPENSIIYCDIPYQNTTSYKVNSFDYKEFWNWAREKSINHSVFVSEYNAPDDFIEVWSKKVNNTLVQNTGSKQGIEKLFVHKSKI